MLKAIPHKDYVRKAVKRSLCGVALIFLYGFVFVSNKADCIAVCFNRLAFSHNLPVIKAVYIREKCVALKGMAYFRDICLTAIG